MTTIELLKRTKAAWPALSAAGEEEKNRLLLAMADALESHIPAILDANGQDMADAQGHISAVMLDRLRLDEGRIRAMAQGGTVACCLPATSFYLGSTFAPARAMDSLSCPSCSASGMMKTSFR